jgi:hypothetical protein
VSADFVNLSGQHTRSALDLVRIELAQVTAAYFAGAPVYDQMHALEDKLFDMMWPNVLKGVYRVQHVRHGKVIDEEFFDGAGKPFHVSPKNEIVTHFHASPKNEIVFHGE